MLIAVVKISAKLLHERSSPARVSFVYHRISAIFLSGDVVVRRDGRENDRKHGREYGDKKIWDIHYFLTNKYTNPS